MGEERGYYWLTRRVFDKLAPFYNIVALPLLKLRGKVVDFSNPPVDSVILDIGTGTGKQAFAFAKRGYQVVGIDLSEGMLKVANETNIYENAKFQVADAANLPFADNSFDISCISFVLHDMPFTIREKTLQEMVRVTKPKGTIVIVDYALPKNTLGRFLIFHLVRLYERHYYSRFVKSDLEGLLGKSDVEIKEELRVLLGVGRILKGIRVDDPAKPKLVPHGQNSPGLQRPTKAGLADRLPLQRLR